MLKLIILDWDDTITTGSFDLYTHCYAAALEETGTSVRQSEVNEIVFKLWGRPHAEVLAALLQYFAHNADLLDLAVKIYIKKLTSESFLEHITPIPGAIEALEQLHAKYSLCVASSGNPHVIKDLLIPRLQIPPVFRQILTSQELADPTRAKPYPDLALRILEEQQILPEEALVVGDSSADMGMATAANIEFVAVLTGQLTREQAEKQGVTHILQSLAELPVFLA